MRERHVALFSTLGNLLMQRIDSFQQRGFSFTSRVKHNAFQCAAVEQLVLHQLLRGAQIILVNTFDQQAGQQSHRLTNRHITWNDVLLSCRTDFHHPPQQKAGTLFVLRLRRRKRECFF